MSATTPEPIEGWKFTCFWKTDRFVDGLQWEARHPEDSEVFAYVDAEGLRVEDRTPYDGQSYFSVPLAVIDALRSLQEKAGLATTEQSRARAEKRWRDRQ